MSLSVVGLLCILSFVAADTDSSDVISNKVTCRDVMREMRSLFEQQEAKFMRRFEQIERNQNSMQEQVNNVAMIVRSLEQGMASVQYDVREVKSVKLANITTSVRSLEQGMASVQLDLREVKSVKLANITTSVMSLEQDMASVQFDLREVKSVKLANITTSVKSLEQSLASVQFDLRKVKSVTLGKQ